MARDRLAGARQHQIAQRHHAQHRAVGIDGVGLVDRLLLGRGRAHLVDGVARRSSADPAPRSRWSSGRPPRTRGSESARGRRATRPWASAPAGRAPTSSGSERNRSARSSADIASAMTAASARSSCPKIWTRRWGSIASSAAAAARTGSAASILPADSSARPSISSARSAACSSSASSAACAGLVRSVSSSSGPSSVEIRMAPGPSKCRRGRAHRKSATDRCLLTRRYISRDRERP